MREPAATADRIQHAGTHMPGTLFGQTALISSSERGGVMTTTREPYAFLVLQLHHWQEALSGRSSRRGWRLSSACGGGGGDEPGPSLTVDPGRRAHARRRDLHPRRMEAGRRDRAGCPRWRLSRPSSCRTSPQAGTPTSPTSVLSRTSTTGLRVPARDNRGPGIRRIDEYTKVPCRSPPILGGLEDALSYTFTLRPGVKFHNIAPVNGREMNIDDWNLLEVPRDRRQPRDDHGRADKVEYPDSRHMVVKMKEPYALLSHERETSP